MRLTEAATAWQILFYRSLALALFLGIVLSLRGNGSLIAVYRKAGISAVLGGLALVLAFCGSIISIQTTTVANAMFLFASAPFFAAVLARLILKERVRRATVIAIVVALVGVVIMVREGISLGHLGGNIAAMGSAIGFALFTIALRWKRLEDMLPAVCLGGVFTAGVAFAACLMTGDSLVISPRDTALAVGLGVVQLGIGMSIFTMGSKVVPAAELALLSMTEVVLGPLWVWLFLGETASFYTLLGGAILLAAIAGNALTNLRHKPPPIAP